MNQWRKLIDTHLKYAEVTDNLRKREKQKVSIFKTIIQEQNGSSR